MSLARGIGVAGVLATVLGLVAEYLQLFGPGLVDLHMHAPANTYAFFGILTLALLGIALFSLLQSIQGIKPLTFVSLLACVAILPFLSVFAFLDVWRYYYIPSIVCAVFAFMLATTQVVVQRTMQSQRIAG